MKFRFLKSETWIALITIVLLTILTHGTQLARLGYYRDDWYLLWNGFTRGFQSIAPIFEGDRPFMGVVYSWVYRFLGNDPLSWHIYALVLKLAGALAFFWLLRMVWPKRDLATTAAVFLFVVYPGFLQQPNANTFQNHLFGYFIALLSIAFTIRAIQTRRLWEAVLLSVFAVLFELIYLNIYEYMIGLEAVRLLLIGYLTFGDEAGSLKEKLIRTLKRWAIYIPAVLAVLYWRVFIFESTRQAMNMGSLLSSYSSSPIKGLFYLLIEFALDLLESIVSAWTVPFYAFMRAATYKAIVYSVFYAALAVGLFLLYYFFIKRRNLVFEDEKTSQRSFVFLWMGLLATIATILPVITAGRTIYFSNQFDRYTLQATLGISLFIVGFVFYGLRANLRVPFLAFLMVLGVMTHYHNQTYHQEFWRLQRELWWQLSWRAPDIADDTVLVAMLPPGYRLAESYEIWGPANIIYRPESEILKIPAEVLNRDTAQIIIRGANDEREQRGAQIIRDYDKALILSMPTAQTCLNAIDGQNYVLSQSEDLLVVQLAPYSKIDRIESNAPSHLPPSSIFGAEPAHTWCFYYQKMSLARQIGDWGEVARLSDEALANGYKPLDLSEWMPVYEGYVNTNRPKDAKQIAKIIKSDKGLQTSICTQLLTLPSEKNYNSADIYATLCEVP